MTTLKDSHHFVPRGDLLRIKSETNFQKVYEHLGQAGRGSFLLVDEGKAMTYVRAYDLADAVVHRAVKEVQRTHSVSSDELVKKLADRTDPVSQALANRMETISQTPIGQVVRDIMSAIFVTIDEAQVDVESDEDSLQTQDYRVFEVYESGESIGWYLNREELKATTTEKPVFICVNGHENPDTDSGTCYTCSGTFNDANKILAMFA
jgi:hypothetical protein